MKVRQVITTAFIVGTAWAAAQTVAEDPQPDPVLDAIHQFNAQDKPAEAGAVQAKEEPAEKAAESPVVEAADTVGSTPAEPAPTKMAGRDLPPKEPTDGLTVRVEKLQSAKGSVDPSKVKLLAPFPAKPLAQAPVGWKLEAANNAPPFLREVEISEGSKITLTIRPHLLVPDADGENAFSIRETGYNHSLGYQQTATVGAILANSVRQLDDDSKRLGSVIENLQQLLISLPKPELVPVKEAPEPAQPIKPGRKK